MTVDEQRGTPVAPAASAVEPPRPADVSGLADTALRSALEFAVGIAAAGQKLRPPLVYPAGLKAHLKSNRLDRPALAAVRRAVIGDETFRTRLGEVATDELVDELGIIWLRRSDGWLDRIRELLVAAREDAENQSTEAALRKAERRREAAEGVAARANAELLAHNDSLAREQMRREKAEEAAREANAETNSLRNEIVGLRREVDKLRQRVDAESRRAERAEAVVVERTEQLRTVEAMRDEILAQRVAPQPSAMASLVADETSSATAAAVTATAAAIQTNQIAARALQQAAAATRDLASALATAGDALASVAPSVATVAPQRLPSRPKPVPRKPIAIPGGVYGDSLAAAAHLLRAAQVVVLVDGYNVAKLAWPTMELIDQRELCIELLEDVARRHGTEIRVVFDGADVVGASARRRLIRVQYSPAGVSADDVIRAEVRAVPAATPVVVVTNDQAIVSDVRGHGANVVSSDMLLAVGGRPLQR